MRGEALRRLPLPALLALAGALEGGRLAPPYPRISVGALVPPGSVDDVCSGLLALDGAGMSAGAIVVALRLIATEREEAQRMSDRLELVWTGPETRRSESRDTSVVARELFSRAERTVLVASFALHQSARIFAPLARRMEERPDLTARLFVDIGRPHGDDATSDAELLRRFADEFRRDHWSGERLPAVFYDPRALSVAPGPRACLHAKCIVADAARAFVTSANFTEAAHGRNIEAGVLIEDAGFARALLAQFDGLVSTGELRVVPGLSVPP